MKRLLFFLLLFTPLGSIALAAEKANTVLIHPGEVVYATFTNSGKKLKLVGALKEKDEQAQVVLTMERNKEKDIITLKVTNRFGKDLLYKAEMRSLTSQMRKQVTTFPVVAGKMSFEHFPPGVEQLALHGFELQR